MGLGKLIYLPLEIVDRRTSSFFSLALRKFFASSCHARKHHKCGTNEHLSFENQFRESTAEAELLSFRKLVTELRISDCTSENKKTSMADQSKRPP